MHVVSVGSSSNIAELSPLYLPISPYISLCLRSASVRAWTSESSRTSRTTTASRRQHRALTLALGVTLTLWGGADPNPNLAQEIATALIAPANAALVGSTLLPMFLPATATAAPATATTAAPETASTPRRRRK